MEEESRGPNRHLLDCPDIPPGRTSGMHRGFVLARVTLPQESFLHFLLSQSHAEMD